MEAVEGTTILVPPSPGTGPLHQTITVLELDVDVKLSDVTRAIEDAETVNRYWILPDVVTLVTGKFKPGATPDAIMEALRQADLLEEEDATPE